jgi:hypothetical protein
VCLCECGGGGGGEGELPQEGPVARALAHVYTPTRSQTTHIGTRARGDISVHTPCVVVSGCEHAHQQGAAGVRTSTTKCIQDRLPYSGEAAIARGTGRNKDSNTALWVTGKRAQQRRRCGNVSMLRWQRWAKEPGLPWWLCSLL